MTTAIGCSFGRGGPGDGVAALARGVESARLGRPSLDCVSRGSPPPRRASGTVKRRMPIPRTSQAPPASVSNNGLAGVAARGLLSFRPRFRGAPQLFGPRRRLGLDGRPDGRRRRRAAGDGLCADRRAAAAIRAVHGHRDDGRGGPVRFVAATHQRSDQRHFDCRVERAGWVSGYRAAASGDRAGLSGRRGADGDHALAAGRPHAVRFARGDRRLHARGGLSDRARSGQEPVGDSTRRS